MVDPYDILGVPNDADAEAIKRAYRNEARKHHPDHGGDRKRFDLVIWARDLLMDEERRQRYDRTGDASEKQPDNATATLIETLHRALNDTLNTIIQQGRKPHQAANFIDMMMVSLENMERKVHADKAETDEAIRVQETLLGRFTAKDKEPIMEALLRGRIAQAREANGKLDRVLESLKAAKETIKGHTFKAEREPDRGYNAGQQTPFIVMLNDMMRGNFP